jgi:hypothetical protein
MRIELRSEIKREKNGGFWKIEIAIAGKREEVPYLQIGSDSVSWMPRAALRPSTKWALWDGPVSYHQISAFNDDDICASTSAMPVMLVNKANDTKTLTVIVFR